MWLFKKKETKEVKKESDFSKIPELPELPPLPDLELSQEVKTRKIRDDLPPLPSYPTSLTGEKVSQETIKQTVKDYPRLPPLSIKKPRTRELEGGIEKIPMGGIKPFVREVNPEMKTEPVFVRIDKYQEALSQFQEIKKQITEIENLLRDIKAIKDKEEYELQSWQEEVQSVKEKLNSIDKTIFQKLEE